MNSPHPLAAWVERNQATRRLKRTRVRPATAVDAAPVRLSRGRSVLPLQRRPQD